MQNIKVKLSIPVPSDLVIIERVELVCLSKLN